jgi:PAS domain S-box-containing protein
LAGSATLREAIPALLESICGATGWEFGEIWRYDPASDVMRCDGVWSDASLDGGELQARTLEITFPHGVGLIGRAWSEARSIWMTDVATDERFLRSAEAARLGLHNAIAFPIRSEKEEVMGVMAFFSRRIDPPDEDLLTLMDLLGRQIAGFVKRKQAEHALRDSEEQLRSIVNTAVDAIITTDGQGRIVSFNRAAERMFGYTAAEAVGQNVGILMPSPYCQEHDEFIARYLQTGKARIIGIGREVVARRKDGTTFPVDLSVSELHTQHQQLFTGIVRDISERKELQAEVLRIADQEQRRIGQELHDNVQQQLTGLGLIAQHLVENLANSTEKTTAGREDGGLVQPGHLAVRLARGITEATGLIRSLACGLIPVEIDAHGLSAALEELASSTNELYAVTCRFECDQPVEVADNFVATHLYRIAQEAITNALRHSGADQIWITLRNLHGAPTLSIVDNGTGITETNELGQGLGLRIMAYRAGLIGAALQVGPASREGTLVRCSLLKEQPSSD